MTTIESPTDLNLGLATTCTARSNRSGIHITVGYASHEWYGGRAPNGVSVREHILACVRDAVTHESALYWDGPNAGWFANSPDAIRKKRDAGTMGVGWARPRSTASWNAGPSADRFTADWVRPTQWRGVYEVNVWVPRWLLDGVESTS